MNQETWVNRGPGTVVVWKFDRHGDPKDEVIRAGAKFTISPEERQQNMDDAANKDLDNFRNGTLVPVRLIESTVDAQEIASNPNNIGEQEMRDLFKSHWRTFESKINEIISLSTLERLLVIADEDEGATVRQLEVLKARVKALSPQLTEVTTESSEPVSNAFKPISRSGRTI